MDKEQLLTKQQTVREAFDTLQQETVKLEEQVNAKQFVLKELSGKFQQLQELIDELPKQTEKVATNGK